MVGNGDIWIIDEDSVAGEWIVNNDIHLMQSTGLFDKNGKEIFEGDIAQFEDCYTETDFLYVNTGIVEWSQGSFTITNRDSVLMEDLLDGDVLDVKIIGNIFENPELLEVEE
nr:YopX family protein [Streptococcus oralis]